MPQVDPKFTFWFGVWTNLLTLFAGYGIEHAPPLVAQYAPTVQWLASFLSQANGVIITALVGVSSTKAGPLVNVPAAAIKPLVLVAVILGSLFAFPGDARAQGLKFVPPTGNIGRDLAAATGSKTTITGAPVTDIQNFLNAKFLPDLQYALKLATAAGNKVTGPCYQAWIDIIQTQQKAVQDTSTTPPTDIPMPDPHVITEFEKIIELRNALTPESDFMMKCSPVASMVKLDIAKFMGVVISGGAGLATLVPGL